MNKWISVSDKLPKDGTEKIVWLGSEYYFAAYDKELKTWTGEDGRKYDYVTHWMQPPTRPAKG